jgi:eukaryotic-like serine/threonine-protein kinase
MPKPKKLTIGAQLGSGGFGTVFVGEDPVKGRVAVKILRRDPSWTEAEWKQFREDLLREGVNLTKAEHDHVVRVFSVQRRLGVPMLVMEFCAGGSLQTSYEAGPLPLPRVKKVAREACFGLAALHARGMLHRDLKPSNILLDARDRAKLTDFGLATDELVLGYASGWGYADHLAKEVHAGKGTSIRSDIWAFGMTLYRLIHGRWWYQSHQSPSVSVPKGGFAKKLKWLPHVPDEWRRLIRKALHDDPHSRFQTVDDLQNALAGVPAPAWNCNVGADTVSWTTLKAGRRYEVVWDVSHPNGLWAGYTVDVASGTKRKLKGKTSVKELEAFLTARA